MGNWPNLESNQILGKQIASVMKYVWWFYETLLLNLLSDYLEWFRQILNKFIKMV